jgi:hypothetical protein
MAKTRSGEELAYRAFLYTMAGVGTWILVAFLYVIL